MYEISEAFHKQYADMYDKFVRIYLKDGSMRVFVNKKVLQKGVKKVSTINTQ